MLSVAFCLAIQDVAELVERLSSDAPEVREEATARLKAIDRAAPQLRKAARDPDPEVAQRARQVLAVLEVRASLSPALRRAMPGVEERLAAGEPRTWTQVFLETGEDAEALAPRAIRGAPGVREAQLVLDKIGRLHMRTAIPEIVRLLREEGDLGGAAAGVLVQLRANEAVPELLKVVGGEAGRWPRVWAIDTLGKLRAGEAFDTLRNLQADPDPVVRHTAARALPEIRGSDSVPSLLPFLTDVNPFVRTIAVCLLHQLRRPEAVPALLPLLDDPETQVRSAAARALGALEAVESAPALARRLRDVDKVRLAAAESLCRLGSRGGVDPHLEAAEHDTDVPLHVLNALRRPADWRRLRSRVVTLNGSGQSELGQALARAAELPMESSAVSRQEEVMWSIAAHTASKREGHVSVIDALEDLRVLNQAEYVLEPDRIRILPRAQALDFWKSWWAEENRK